jgi:peptide/nickel transport system substrate-binding protein
MRLQSGILLVLALVMSGCATGGPARPGGGEALAPAASVPKTLTIALEDEPLNLATLLDQGSSSAGEIRHVVHSRLAKNDDRGNVMPELATELPSQERGTWSVQSDGTMRTTYKLRSGVTWHDGTPLTPRDFILAWTMTMDPDLPISQQSVARQISDVTAPDDQTLVIDWKNTYPFANAIIEDDLGPFPSHIFSSVYPGGKERVAQMPYWTREFVGVGPYQLTEWLPGSELTLKAYDRFWGGRPKIDTLVFRFIESPSTVLSNLLAGTVDGTSPRALDFAGAVSAKEQWEAAGRSPAFVVQSANWRRLGVQFREPNPREITDVRVRKGLFQAIDRKALVDALFGGYAPASDVFVAPDDAKYEWVKDAIVRYDYDTRRAEQQLAETGWRRGADGAVVNSAGERVTVNLWTTAGVEREIAIIADAWKNLGLNVDQHVLTPAENRDDRFRVSYPSFSIATFPASFEFTISYLHSTGCPSEQSRWRGNNRGCYQNSENDRLVDEAKVAIGPADQQRLHREIARLRTDQLPEMPLYFVINLTVFRDGVTGIKGAARPRGGLGWNVMEWDVRG